MNHGWCHTCNREIETADDRTGCDHCGGVVHEDCCIQIGMNYVCKACIVQKDSMTKEKLDSVFAQYADWLRKHNTGLIAQRIDIAGKHHDFEPVLVARHMLWMCEEARQFIAQGRIEKAMRWLGFLQGMFYCHDNFSIEELGNHSRPDAPKGESDVR